MSLLLEWAKSNYVFSKNCIHTLIMLIREFSQSLNTAGVSENTLCKSESYTTTDMNKAALSHPVSAQLSVMVLHYFY